MKHIFKPALFMALAIMLGMGAVSEAAAASDISSLQRELDAKNMELDREVAANSPNGARIEKLSREIGELRGKLLNTRVSDRGRYEYNSRPDYSEYYDRRGDYYSHHGRGHHRGRGCW